MVTTDGEGVRHVTIVRSKPRVFPFNEKSSGLHGSMPRKELAAAMLGVDLLGESMRVFEELQPRIYCWTDSYSVLDGGQIPV